MRIVNRTLIQAPLVSGWKCDICGETFFDSRAVRQLELLISDGGPPPNQHAAPGAAPEAEPVEPPRDTDSAASLRPPSK